MKRANAQWVVCSLAIAGLIGACGADEGDADPGEATTPAPSGEPVDERLVLENDVDHIPPIFDGLQEIELIGEQTYRFSWEPARDNVSRSPTIVYEVALVQDAFSTPDADVTPDARSRPGEVSMVATIEGRGGRFFSRAVDQAGNASAWTAPLSQRSSRPWIAAHDGRPLGTVRDCGVVDAARTVCVGTDGFAARWERDRWIRLDVPDADELRVAHTVQGPFIYSTEGHLLAVEPSGELRAVHVRFGPEMPTLPIRQFTTDPLGLHYWIDADGRVYLGPEGEARRARFPLGIIDIEECETLQGVAFSDRAGFAVCSEGAVYSVSALNARWQWLALTASTPFELPDGFHGAWSSDDARALIRTHAGLREVAVGGWTRVALPERPLPGARPDAIPMRIGSYHVEGDVAFLGTDIGLWRRSGDGWTPVPGLEGDVVTYQPPAPLDPPGQLAAIYVDTGVATVNAGRRAWRATPVPRGIVAGHTQCAAGPIAITHGENPGLWRAEEGVWTRVSNLPTELNAPSARIDALRGCPSERGAMILAASYDVPSDGEDARVSAIWEWTGTTWARATLVFLPPPPAREPEEGAPPPALTGVPPARAAEGVVRTLDPVVDADFAADGRAIAITERDVWWRVTGGWLHLATPTTASALRGVSLDAGETYLLVHGEDGALAFTRCWRDQCVEAPPPMGDEAIVQSWRSDEGRLSMTAAGAVARFVPAAFETPAREVARDHETPRGTWHNVEEALDQVDDLRIIRRSVGIGPLVVVDEGHHLYERVDGQWISQGHVRGFLDITGDHGAWYVLGADGLLALDTVPSISRASDGR